LEIAWHCVRGGRVEEAVPYLLRGARQALQRGAPHSVELALRSGYSLLIRAHDKGGAKLLLAESVSEQADWPTALQILDNLDVPLDSDQEASRRALICVANCNVWRYDDALIADDLGDLLGRLAVITEPFAVALVARALSSLVLTDRGIEVAQKVNDALSQHHARLAIGPARQEWLLACIRVRYVLEDPRDVGTSMSLLSDEMKATKTKSSAAADLALGQGNACCKQGQYALAIEHFERSAALAAELGHQSLLACSAANRALCYGYLGHYDKQITFAKLALSLEAEYPNAYRRILARYNLARGHALRNERVEALMAIDELEAVQIEVAPQWVRQAKDLFLADALWLAGKRKRAKAAAYRAVEGALRKPLSTSFAGHHSRWIVRVAADMEQAYDDLEELLEARSKLDQLDQLEVTVAYAYLASELGRPSAVAAWKDVQSRLPSLPEAIEFLLSKFGLIQSSDHPAQAE